MYVCIYVYVHIYIYIFFTECIIIPVGARFSAPVKTRPGAHPTAYAVGTGSFSGVMRPGRGVDHPTPSTAEVKERVKLFLYSPYGPSCRSRVNCIFNVCIIYIYIYIYIYMYILVLLLDLIIRSFERKLACQCGFEMW